MKIQIIMRGLLIFGGFFLIQSSMKAAENPFQIITCSDGDQFIIEKSSEVNAVHPQPSYDGMIKVDVKRHRLMYFQNGKLLHSYPVAIGDEETPSPIGEWKIIHKGGNWGGGFGERWMGIDVPWGIYGIHGTNKPWTIGTPSSHGCIRMLNYHVIELYNLVKIGTPVHMIGTLPPVVPRKEVKRNNTGRDIVAFQFAIRKAGFNPGRIDGRFGIEMEKAIYRLQFLYGLPPTGRVSLDEQIILGFH